MQLEIKRLHDRLGITFIYVTHDQKEALVMSDRVAVLNRGRIEQIGAPTELYDEPANVFVASFIGEANFLDAKVVGAEPGLSVLATAGGLVRGPASSCTRLMVRPEKIAVLRPGGTVAAPALNTLPGTVRETIFMGEMLRYVVALADGQTLSAKHQHRADVPVLAPGEPAVVAWAVADTRLV
jgi:ABC-type Fe3+/spermidine/putrescine transport system ATPase subunit